MFKKNLTHHQMSLTLTTQHSYDIGLTNRQRKICLFPNVEREDSGTPEHHGKAEDTTTVIENQNQSDLIT